VFCVDLGINSKFSLHNIKRLVFITNVESVYCAVRTKSLYNTDTFRLIRLVFVNKIIIFEL
jgi:hypothetical protein